MRAIVRTVVLATLGLAVLAGSWAVALPKRASLLGGECNCQCNVDGGAGPSLLGLVTGLPNSFANCGVYNSKTCNVSDPATGGVRSGQTVNCCQVQDNGTCRDSTSGTIVAQPTRIINGTLTTTTTTTPTTPPATRTQTQGTVTTRP